MTYKEWVEKQDGNILKSRDAWDTSRQEAINELEAIKDEYNKDQIDKIIKKLMANSE